MGDCVESGGGMGRLVAVRDLALNLPVWSGERKLSQLRSRGSQQGQSGIAREGDPFVGQLDSLRCPDESKEFWFGSFSWE